MGQNASDIFVEHGLILSEDELAHYGKKGMKWGKRRQAKSTAKAEAKAEADARPKAKDLNDDDLKKAINRLKLEKEYATLTAPHVSEGRKIVAEILRDVGKQQAKNYLNRNIDLLTGQNPKETAKAIANVATKVAAAPKPKVVFQLNKNHGLKL